MERRPDSSFDPRRGFRPSGGDPLIRTLLGTGAPAPKAKAQPQRGAARRAGSDALPRFPFSIRRTH